MLIFCCSPVQILTASAMLRANGSRHYKLIYCTWSDNEKHRLYFERLAKGAAASAYVPMIFKSPINFLNFRRALCKVRAWDERDIALANINLCYLQYSINTYRGGKIITFDDGRNNIDSGSPYFVNRPKPLMIRCLNLALRGRVDEHWIRHHSSAHYTLYPEFENIVEKRRLIPISIRGAQPAPVTLPSQPRLAKGRELRVFLGKQVVEISDPALKKAYPGIVTSFQDAVYLPHPQETPPPEAHNIVRTPLIAEEYVLSQLDHFERISIFSMYSTALLNIDHPNVTKTIVTYPNASKAIANFYPTFAQRGCNLLSAG